MMDDAIRWVTQATPATFWISFTLTAVAAVAAFVYAFVFWHRLRLIEDTPTARIRSAAQGYAELSGRAESMDEMPVVAPLSGEPCVWYRYKVEKLGDKHSRVIDSGTSEALFLLVGSTGRCVVDPEDAKVVVRRKAVWHAHRYPSPPRRGRDVGGLFGNLSLVVRLGGIGGRYRYTEERLRPGEPLFALGQFTSVGGSSEAFDTAQEVRDLLRRWKQDRQRLLQRFDGNDDGEIDAQEWAEARRTAQHEVQQAQLERSIEPLVHMLHKPDQSGRPYLLSALGEAELTRRFRRIAGLSLGGFFLLGAAAVWMVAVRLQA